MYLGGIRLACQESSQVFNDKYGKIGFTGGLRVSNLHYIVLEDYGAKLNFQKCDSVVITGTDIVQPNISELWEDAKECSSSANLTVALGYPSFFTSGASRPMLIEINEDFINVVIRQSDDLAIPRRTNFKRHHQLRGYIGKARHIFKEFRDHDELHSGEWKEKSLSVAMFAYGQYQPLDYVLSGKAQQVHIMP
ncbi:hypothetical protein V8E51_002969 [Hyaloscypha variabilis]